MAYAREIITTISVYVLPVIQEIVVKKVSRSRSILHIHEIYRIALSKQSSNVIDTLQQAAYPYVINRDVSFQLSLFYKSTNAIFAIVNVIQISMNVVTILYNAKKCVSILLVVISVLATLVTFC